MINRRAFLHQSTLGIAAMGTLPWVSGPWYQGQQSDETDIVIFGAGAGGLCAGIQAARLGAHVVLLEPSSWVGGMLTAAGVSALDGNKHGAGGGLVHRFREQLAEHYGSIDDLHTGWISLYCYEPHVAHAILQEWVAEEDRLDVIYGVEATGYECVGTYRRRIQVTEVQNPLDGPACGGAQHELTCSVFIDASEYGDGLPLAGIPFRLGRESRHELGESAAPEEPDLEMQDLTYAATLVRREGAAPMPVTPQDRALWHVFQCSTSEDCPTPDPDLLNHTVHDWERFITYAELPNGKVLLNWPHHANDFPITAAFFNNRFFRGKLLRAAKQHTVQFVKYMQTVLGHAEWQIATDEYPTPDNLPLIPYMREARRIVNDDIFVQDDVIPANDHPRAPMVETAIAVGDYFIDHHHAKHHLPPACRLHEDYPDNAPFQVPMSVFFPDTEDPSFLVGEKSIAVSHIVNGCTRLQPVVMLMGQALGTIAAFATQEGRAPRDVSVDRVQSALLDAGCQLYIAYDVPTGHDLFRPVQDLALAGVLRDDDPVDIMPDEPISARLALKWARRAELSASLSASDTERPLRRAEVQEPLRGSLSGTGDVLSRGAFLRALHVHRSTA